MKRWLGCADALLMMIIHKVPSPAASQRLRTQYLYEGPVEDPFTVGIENCDPKAPLVLFVYRFLPLGESQRLCALGRVFSGTVSQGSKIWVIGPQHKKCSKFDIYETKVESVFLGVGPQYTQALPSVVCGNIVALTGIDRYLMKPGTVSDHPDCLPVKTMSYTSPILSMSVATKEPANLPKLIGGLKRLSSLDSAIAWETEETGENMLFGYRESHLRESFEYLQRTMPDCELISSELIVRYRETVTVKTNETCLAKSANKHNRLWGSAEPLGQGVTKAIEEGYISASDNIKERVKKLCEEFCWDRGEALNLCSFGPNDSGPNLLVNTTIGVQYFTEIKDSVIAGWLRATKQGVLAEEEMRGVRMNI